MNHNMREIPVCEVCRKPANQICGGCKLVYYCTKAHQKLGWREGHKSKCRAFRIEFSDNLGRHMVASRNIKQGEMIIKEKAAVIGPKISSQATCLSCAKKLIPQKFKDKYDFYKCSSCNWPMCGPQCEKSDIHIPECNIMTDRKYQCNIVYDNPDKSEPAYCVIAPLRVLLMKESDPEQYQNIMNLESHLEERVNTPLYTILKANLVTFVIQVLGLKFNEETILKVASIFDTNSFDVRSFDRSKRSRAIYVTASMMNHSCNPNTRHIFMDDDNKLALIATVPIAKGELITASYTQSLWGTLDRRKHLFTTKYFYCECQRCKDPTEFGTYLGSIYCSVCNQAALISTDPLDELAPWKCENCPHSILSKQMIWGNNALKEDLKKMDKNGPNGFEQFIETYSRTLHPKNHIIIQAKLALVQIYGVYKGYTLQELTDNKLQRKIDLCYELLEVMDILEPGSTKIRGTLLLELQGAMVMRIKREFESEKLTKEAAQDQLMQSMSLLREATTIFHHDQDMKETLENKFKELSSMLITAENGVS